jgi:uncharacterized membrane protein
VISILASHKKGRFASGLSNHLMFEKKIINPDLQWIQALRGIAALMVLFFHMHPHWDLIPTLSMTTAVTRW